MARAQTLRRASDGADDGLPVAVGVAVTGDEEATGGEAADFSYAEPEPEAPAEPEPEAPAEPEPEAPAVTQETAARRVALADGQWLLHKGHHLGPGTEIHADEFDEDSLKTPINAGALVEL